jgi:hypothetical protein
MNHGLIGGGLGPPIAKENRARVLPPLCLGPSQRQRGRNQDGVWRLLGRGGATLGVAADTGVAAGVGLRVLAEAPRSRRRVSGIAVPGFPQYHIW